MKFFSRWGIVFFIIAAISLGVWNFLISKNEVERIDTLLIEYNSLVMQKNEKQLIIDDLIQEKLLLAGTLKASENMTSNQEFMHSVLIGINNSIPNQYLKLSKINFDDLDGVMVYGITTSDNNILSFIDNLSKVSVIEKASLVTMSVETIYDQNAKSFTINLTLAPQDTVNQKEEKNGN